MALRRIQLELANLVKNPLENASAGPIGPEDQFTWSATIKGETNSVYENGVFQLNLQFPTDYPFKPPKVISSNTFAIYIYMSSSDTMRLHFV